LIIVRVMEACMAAGRSFACLACVVLSACGLRVPEIQEVGGRVEGQRFVQAVLTNITCELRGALGDLRQSFPKGTFIDSWGVQTTLILTYDETGAIAPGVLWTPPANGTFSLGAGLTVSSDATRINTINAYYLVSDLERARCSDEARPNGAFLLQSDLKLSEWLFDAVSASMTNTINFTNTALAVPQNVLQHEVKFQIVTSGTLNPSWMLTRLTVNAGSTLFSAGRTRTNDLIITFGPAAPAVVAAAKGGGSRVRVAAEPIRQAADLHLSSSIAAGIEAAVKNTLR
jgi:hypothetical protein